MRIEETFPWVSITIRTRGWSKVLDRSPRHDLCSPRLTHHPTQRSSEQCLHPTYKGHHTSPNFKTTLHLHFQLQQKKRVDNQTRNHESWQPSPSASRSYLGSRWWFDLASRVTPSHLTTHHTTSHTGAPRPPWVRHVEAEADERR